MPPIVVVAAAAAVVVVVVAAVVCESSSKNVNFAHHSGALARPGNQELCAVKISGSCDA